MIFGFFGRQYSDDKKETKRKQDRERHSRRSYDYNSDAVVYSSYSSSSSSYDCSSSSYDCSSSSSDSGSCGGD